MTRSCCGKRVAGGGCAVGLVVLLGVLSGPAAGSGMQDWKAALTAERTANEARIAEIEKQAPPVYADYQASQKAIEAHNASPCTATEDNPGACDSYNAEAESLNTTSGKLLAQLQAFKDEEDKLIARNDEITKKLNCVQLPTACTANSDCTCSNCCGTWDGTGKSGICQPTCDK